MGRSVGDLLTGVPFSCRPDRFRVPPSPSAGGCPEVSGSPNRFNGLTGAEAALLLMAEMRAGDSSAAPDVVTYTTVLSGVVRAEVS